MIKIITVINNSQMYDRFFKKNPYINNYDLIAINNHPENLGLPRRYNEVIDNFVNSDTWLFFVHEDFEVKNSLDIIFSLNKHYIYGTFGINLVGKFPVCYGYHKCSNKDGSNPVSVGEKVQQPVEVETLDCQSILVHASLFKKYKSLRFDEALTFDLYAEDICIKAKQDFGIGIFVFPLAFQHYSHGNITERYFVGKQYLAEKYPDVGVPGSCSFIGGNVKELEKGFEYRVGTDVANKKNWVMKFLSKYLKSVRSYK